MTRALAKQSLDFLYRYWSQRLCSLDWPRCGWNMGTSGHWPWSIETYKQDLLDGPWICLLWIILPNLHNSGAIIHGTYAHIGLNLLRNSPESLGPHVLCLLPIFWIRGEPVGSGEQQATGIQHSTHYLLWYIQLYRTHLQNEKGRILLVLVLT